MGHHAQIIFCIFIETGFHHVDQDGLDLLTSGDLSTSASQSAEITGVSHRAWPNSVFFTQYNDDYLLSEKLIPSILIVAGLTIRSHLCHFVCCIWF